MTNLVFELFNFGGISLFSETHFVSDLHHFGHIFSTIDVPPLTQLAVGRANHYVGLLVNGSLTAVAESVHGPC